MLVAGLQCWAGVNWEKKECYQDCLPCIGTSSGYLRRIAIRTKKNQGKSLDYFSFETSSYVFSFGVKIYPFTQFYCPHKLCWCARTRGCQQGFMDVFYPNIVKSMNWSKFSDNTGSADLSRLVSETSEDLFFKIIYVDGLFWFFYTPTLKTISGRLLMFYLTLNVREIMKNVSQQTVTLDRPAL